MEYQIVDPYHEIIPSRSMSPFWRGLGLRPIEKEQWNIPIDVTQKEDEIVVTASLPGVKPEEIEVSVEDNVLTIKAESSQEYITEESEYLIRERSFGTFYRELRLPDSVDTDKIHSTYEDGILAITMHKAEEKKKKQIKVHTKNSRSNIKTEQT
jgi:HSP20 family protein